MFKDIHIAIIDDHSIFLEGISLLIKEINFVTAVETYVTPAAFIDAFQKDKKFDLVICDLIMNAMNGLAFLGAVRHHCKKTPVLVLSGINVAPPIDEIKRLGGNGFVHKSAGQATLITAIETVLSNKSFFLSDEIISEDLETSAPQRINTFQVPKISSRQCEILRLISDGHSNRDISDMLNISENTVKTHLKQVFLELGVSKRTACVKKAQSLGFI